MVAKAFFPEPRPAPTEFIIVPACAECNRGKWGTATSRMNMDEEYTRSIFILEDNAGNHPAARTLLNGPVKRSMRKNPSITQLMFPRTDRVLVARPDGQTRVAQRTYIRWERIQRVIEKIVRGLYYHETGHALPQSHEVVSEPLLLAGMADSPRRYDVIFALLTLETNMLGKRRLADGVFSYAFIQLDENDPAHITWLIRFYDGIAIHVVTRPENRGL